MSIHNFGMARAEAGYILPAWQIRGGSPFGQVLPFKKHCELQESCGKACLCNGNAASFISEVRSKPSFECPSAECFPGHLTIASLRPVSTVAQSACLPATPKIVSLGMCLPTSSRAVTQHHLRRGWRMLQDGCLHGAHSTG